MPKTMTEKTKISATQTRAPGIVPGITEDQLLSLWTNSYARGYVVRFPSELVELIEQADPNAAQVIREMERIGDAYEAAKVRAGELRKQLAEYPKVRGAELAKAAVDGTDRPQDRTTELEQALRDEAVSVTALSSAQNQLAHQKAANAICRVAAKVYALADAEAVRLAQEALKATTTASELLSALQQPARAMAWATRPASFQQHTTVEGEQDLFRVTNHLRNFIETGGTL